MRSTKAARNCGSANGGILSVTLNPALDTSSETETVRPTRKISTSNTWYDIGSGGINVAHVIAALGGDVEALLLAGGEGADRDSAELFDAQDAAVKWMIAKVIAEARQAAR